MRDRGQSELVGFALIFGMIVLTITVVTATGYVGLENAQDHERTENAKRGFAVLADNVDDVTRRGAPSRTTQIELADAKVSLDDEDVDTITISGEHSSDPDRNFSHTYSVQPIVYEAGSDAKLVYSGGAVVHQHGEGMVMAREPKLVLTSDAVVVPIVQTTLNGETPDQTGGSTSVRVRTSNQGSTVVQANDTEYEVTLTITTSRADAWERYLRSNSALNCTRTDETVSCTLTTQRVFVTVERVAVSFE